MLRTRLEIGLVAGAKVLLVIGLGASAYAFYDWAGTRFGNLDPFRSMRIIIPAVLALTLGLQVIFSSFYLGLLQLQFRKLQGRQSPGMPAGRSSR